MAERSEINRVSQSNKLLFNTIHAVYSEQNDKFKKVQTEKILNALPITSDVTPLSRSLEINILAIYEVTVLFTRWSKCQDWRRFDKNTVNTTELQTGNEQSNN